VATLRNASSVTQSIPSIGLIVAPGDTFECSAELAAELAERPDFERPKRGARKASPAKKAAPKKTSATPADTETAAPADDPKES